MPLVEVEDAELNVLRSAKALIDRFGSNPKTRAQLHALVKEIDPTVIIPEHDAKNEVLKEIEKRDSQIAELRKLIEDDKTERTKKEHSATVENSIASGRKKLRDDGYTDEGVQGVEKLMEERGIADYDAAAALFERTNPKDEPVSPSDYGRDWNLMKPEEKDEDHKLLLKDPKAFQAKQIRQFMTERRQASGRR